MPPLFTGRGDDGTTGTLGKGRLPKYHPRIETLGALDEASAALGLARALSRDPGTGAVLVEIQRDLYALMAEVATPRKMPGGSRACAGPGWNGWNRLPPRWRQRSAYPASSSCPGIPLARQPWRWRVRSSAGRSAGWPSCWMRGNCPTGRCCST